MKIGWINNTHMENGHQEDGLDKESSRIITVNKLPVSGYINTKINEGLELNKSLLMKPDYVANIL